MGTRTGGIVWPNVNPDTASVVEGNGGLQKVRITSPEAEGEIYLHGAHVTSWKPAGREEVLFLSSQSRGKTGAPFAGAYPSVSPGLETRRTTPRRRRMDSCERRRGNWSRSRRPKTGLR